jgi:hypothetical protein
MLTASQVLDRYYLETRCAPIELAATLDRFDRGNGSRDIAGDPRVGQIREALTLLASESPQPDRAKRLLELFSDPAE